MLLIYSVGRFLDSKSYSYFICNEEGTEREVCEIKGCEVDNCIKDFYDDKGNLVESYFKEAGEEDNPKTQVKDCKKIKLPINWCKISSWF